MQNRYFTNRRKHCLQVADNIQPPAKALNIHYLLMWEQHHPSANLEYVENVSHLYQQIHIPAQT